MNKLIFGVTGLIILGLINFSIWQKQSHLDNGKVVRLELAPVDPRSIMQGDYMVLNFALSWDIRNAITGKNEQPGTSLSWSPELFESTQGWVKVVLDDNLVARFDRLEDKPNVDDDHIVLHYRMRNGVIKFATNAFFFAEGEEPVYRNARFGEFRVNHNGDVLLTHLLDENFITLGQKD